MSPRKKPIRKMEEFKGVKIRSHGPTAEMLKCLGATPVAFPMPELYQSLQKGVVDGGVFPMEALKGWKLAEVTNCHIQCPPIPYSLGFFVVMNKDKWNSLPADIQDIIENKVVPEAEEFSSKLTVEAEMGAVETLRANMKAVNFATPEQMAEVFEWKKQNPANIEELEIIGEEIISIVDEHRPSKKGT